MNILCIDFMNAAHRARSGFQLGQYSVVYNFFRQLKSLIDKFEPTRVYVALEGKPVARKAAHAEYKANRIIGDNDPRKAELESFAVQKDIVLQLLKEHFPVSVVRHPTFEADDTIANLIKTSSAATQWTVVSTDTDFIQLLQEYDNVRIYNPVKKQFVEAPEGYDYVTWKALRGDPSDNIPGVPGIGDKTAAKIASDAELLSEHLGRPEVETIFTKNYDLIRFAEWSDSERIQMTSSSPAREWEAVKAAFTEYNFGSITKEGSWQKFVEPFDKLWGNHQ